MSRREFTKAVKRDAAVRAGGNCEKCTRKLLAGDFHYDHVIPDGLGGEPTLDNCEVLCRSCHSVKTTKQDVPAIAKTKRIAARHLGIRKPSRMPGSRESKYKRKISGEVVLRERGALVHNK